MQNNQDEIPEGEQQRPSLQFPILGPHRGPRAVSVARSERTVMCRPLSTELPFKSAPLSTEEPRGLELLRRRASNEWRWGPRPPAGKERMAPRMKGDRNRMRSKSILSDFR
jgi:hypothetical protein